MVVDSAMVTSAPINVLGKLPFFVEYIDHEPDDSPEAHSFREVVRRNTMQEAGWTLGRAWGIVNLGEPAERPVIASITDSSDGGRRFPFMTYASLPTTHTRVGQLPDMIRRCLTAAGFLHSARRAYAACKSKSEFNDKLAQLPDMTPFVSGDKQPTEKAPTLSLAEYAKRFTEAGHFPFHELLWELSKALDYVAMKPASSRPAVCLPLVEGVDAAAQVVSWCRCLEVSGRLKGLRLLAVPEEAVDSPRVWMHFRPLRTSDLARMNDRPETSLLSPEPTEPLPELGRIDFFDLVEQLLVRDGSEPMSYIERLNLEELVRQARQAT